MGSRQDVPRRTPGLRRDEAGVWYLYAIEEDAITDAERAAAGGPTLEESRQRAVAMHTPRE